LRPQNIKKDKNLYKILGPVSKFPFEVMYKSGRRST